MDGEKRPVRTTLLFGLVCGLLFIPVSLVFQFTIFWPFIFRLTLFSYLAVYSIILAGWGNKKRFAVIFPLVFLFIFVFNKNTFPAFLLLSMGMLSWIRSGICFQNSLGRTLGVEIMTTIGGGALVACFNPHSTLSWALGIWLFFVVQSLYFILLKRNGMTDEATFAPDVFDRARMRAERILKRQ